MRGKTKWQIPNHVARLKIIRKKKDSTKKLIDFLRGYEAEFYVRDVILLHEDEIALSKSHPIE